MPRENLWPDDADIAAIRRNAEQVASAYPSARLRAFVQDLAVDAGWRAREQRTSGLRHSSPIQLVLELGGRARSARPQVFDGIQPGTPRLCYANAAEVALTRPEFLYVEGYAEAGFLPVPHAWCLHLPSGRILDPTWVHLRHLEGRALYLGVRFASAFVRSQTDGDQPASILASDWQRGFRALKDGFVTDASGVVVARSAPPARQAAG